MADNIRFIAVARATDKSIVCSRVQNPNDPSKDNYYDMLSKVLRASTWSEQVLPDSRHTLECDPNKFHFTADNEDRVFIVIADMKYPVRVAFDLIQDLKNELVPKFGDKILTMQEVRAISLSTALSIHFASTNATASFFFVPLQNGLDKTCGKILQRLAEKFDDPSKVDKLAGVQAQVCRGLNKR
jgi:hypothetical protein